MIKPRGENYETVFEDEIKASDSNLEIRTNLFRKAGQLGYSKKYIADRLGTSSQNIGTLLLREAPRSKVASRLDRWLKFVVLEGNHPDDYLPGPHTEEETIAGIGQLLKQAVSVGNQRFLPTKDKVKLMHAHVSTVHDLLNELARDGSGVPENEK